MSATVAVKVAEAAANDGVAGVQLQNPVQEIHDRMWQPQYPKVEVVTNEYTPKRRDE